MASRQEQKEQRRREREEREAAARKSAQRKRTLQIGGGAALVVAVIAAVVIVVAVGGSSGSGTANASDVVAKAKAAGCTFRSFPQFGRGHTLSKVKYKSNPPTSGPHNPTPAADGVYAPGDEPKPENFVHTLEHGRVEFQYKPGTSSADIQRIVALAQEPLHGTPSYHTLVFENDTNMPFNFAAAAWQHYIGCSNLSPASMDAMRAFRQAFTDKAPEQIP
jgi:uncharacterized protein DUF3105